MHLFFSFHGIDSKFIMNLKKIIDSFVLDVAYFKAMF
jgi:hypothetical protein